MESLDKVIAMYNGIWPEFDWDSNDNNQNAIVETIQTWYHDGEDKYHEVGQISKGGTAVDRAYCKVICTKEQFEQRVKQLKEEISMTNWYDYNNQEMVSLPPVGEIVIVITDHSEENLKVKILEYTNNGFCDVAVCQIISDFDPNLGRLGYYQYFYPLDLKQASEKKKLIDKAVQIMYDNACATKGELINGVKRLYELGYLKSPEDK